MPFVWPRSWSPIHLTFLEDPVSLEQVEYIRQIKNASSIPIAEGELFNNPYEYRTLITERLIDYIRVHITQVGGITPARKLQIFAEQFGVRTAWHGPVICPRWLMQPTFTSTWLPRTSACRSGPALSRPTSSSRS